MPLQIAPNLPLASSLLFYPLLFRLITSSKATPARFAQSRETLSILHSIFISVLAATELRRHYDKWAPPPHSLSRGSGPSGADLDFIRTRSAPGNAIIAWECGYLIQDSVILGLVASKQHRAALAKGLNWRVLVWHHFGIATALGLFHLRALRGEEKGVLVILMLFLMNVSYVFFAVSTVLPQSDLPRTPFGTLHWFLVNFRPTWRYTIFINNLAYLALYALGRVYLLYYILDVFGARSGHSAVRAFLALPRPCRLGTSVVGTSNAIWFLMGVWKFMKRYGYAGGGGVGRSTSTSRYNP